VVVGVVRKYSNASSRGNKWTQSTNPINLRNYSHW
jgi:hypothetical protein